MSLQSLGTIGELLLGGNAGGNGHSRCAHRSHVRTTVNHAIARPPTRLYDSLGFNEFANNYVVCRLHGGHLNALLLYRVNTSPLQ